MFANLAEKGILFILLTLMARKLGSEPYGHFFTAFAFVSIIFIFNELGITRLCNREIAKDRHTAKKYLNNSLGIRSLSLPITFLASCCIIILSNYPEPVKTGVVILSLYCVVTYLSHPYIGVFRGLERMDLAAIIILADRLTVIILSSYFLYIKASLIGVQFAFVAGGLLRVALARNFVKKYVPVHSFSYDYRFWKTMLRQSFPIGLYMILSLIYYRVDTVLLSMLGHGSSEVGWYNAGYNIFSVLSLPAMAYAVATFPGFSRLFIAQDSRLKKFGISSLLSVGGASFLICGASFLLADPLISMLYGAGYSESIKILKILSIAALFSSINWFLQWVMIAINRSKELLYILLIGTTLNIVLNIIIIPSMAAIGASITTVITELFISMSCLAVLYSLTSKKTTSRKSTRD